ncbi:MAG: oligoribonuclease [Polyangiaceae bacterium]|nr:oligoribonuclease [Polyangiaceae bacterium]
MARSGNLVWVDLEMTGLDPDRCVIVEIATLVTTGELELVAEGPNLVVHQPAEVLARMEPEVRRMHDKNGLTAASAASTVSLAEAEAASLAFVAAHCEPRTAPLCGNSVWKDKQFLERYMPAFVRHLHYRVVDVSTIKELVRRWYPNGAGAVPKKREAHRALDDIQESIAELRYYRSRVFRSELAAAPTLER